MYLGFIGLANLLASVLDYLSYKKLTGYNDDSISYQSAVLSANKLAELLMGIMGKRVGLSIIQEAYRFQ